MPTRDGEDPVATRVPERIAAAFSARKRVYAEFAAGWTFRKVAKRRVRAMLRHVVAAAHAIDVSIAAFFEPVPAWGRGFGHAGVEEALAVIRGRLKAAREAAGLSTHAAAEALGRTHEQVIRHESGARSMYVATFVAYCRLYNVLPEDISR